MTGESKGESTTDSSERSLRIAMISYYLPSASKIGVGYQAHELASELVRRGHHVDMISDCPPVEGATYGHIDLGGPGRLRTFRFAWRIRGLDLSSYDVLHAHGDDYWLFRRRVPRHIRTVHGSCFEEALRIGGFKERVRMVALGFSEVLASMVADHTVVVSPRTRRWLPWVRTVIPNGVDTRRFAPAQGARASAPTVLFVGTWGNRKRGGVLAEQFQRDVLPHMPDARLEMVCRDAPEDPGAGVRVLGSVSDAELTAAYQRAWVFCLPSAYEGFGIPYAEAMASGVPVVSTPNVGARYVTGDGKAGVLVELDQLGSRLRGLLEDGEEQSRLRSAGLARAQDFDLGTVVDRYLRLYRARAGKPETVRPLL